MKKSVRFTLIIVGILYAIYVLFGLTGILKLYSIPTTANEPGILLNSKILVSNLANYENGDFVCYNFNDEMLGKHIRVHRLLGKAGDVVEIKKGVLYINDMNVDENMELKFSYLLEPEEAKNLLDKKIIKREDGLFRIANKFSAVMSKKIAVKNGLAAKINIEPENEADPVMFKKFQEKWNRDNFGPLKIPDGKCFVIGDNRHNSQDSRYNGLIDESSIVGTVVWK